MTPRVGVVVLNYNGGEVTLACLRSLLAAAADPVPVVLVDNASDDGIAARVRDELPAVTVIESATNRGFAGGCNLGVRALGEVEHVALVNNDATVDAGWLAPLVGTLESDASLGAACPKILFADRFVELTIEAETHRRGRGDRRQLGVSVLGARTDGKEAWDRAQTVCGFWGPEPGPTAARAEWTAASARLRVPVGGGGPHTGELLLAAAAPVRVTVASGGHRVELDVATRPTWHEVPLDGPPLTVVNNVGTDLVRGGYAADRGYLQVDDGQFDEPQDVFAWCGGAVLLRRRYLEQVGLFDERLFLYYEDVELAWRGRRLGWRYRSVPASTVRHLHAATTNEGSALKRYYDERNRLLVVARHAPAGVALRAPFRYLLSTASYARRDILSPLLRGRHPRPLIVRQRIRAFVGYLARLAPMLRARRRDRRRGLEAPVWEPSWDARPSTTAPLEPPP
jgi:GT2 family glycosyltransferase